MRTLTLTSTNPREKDFVEKVGDSSGVIVVGY
jgi:hypothetical protein